MQLRAIHLDLKVDQEVAKMVQKLVLVLQVVDEVDLEEAEDEEKGK